MVGASNVYNQIIEKDLDVLMDRTKNRPIPSGRMSVQLAFIIAVSLTIIGIIALYIINPITAMFGSVCIFMYVSLYTPLKTKTPLSVFVGAFPGAIPFMLGWVAATDDFGIAAGTLFAIQFFWQFPHFIAIAWVQHKDYKKAGFKMLFGGEKTKYPAIISISTSVFMTGLSITPFFCDTSGLSLSIYAFILVLVLGIWFTYKSVLLYQNTDNVSARKLMISSFLYLPLMQIVYVIDRFLF